MEDMYHHVFPVTQIPLPPAHGVTRILNWTNANYVRSCSQCARHSAVCAAVGNGESWRSREFALREIYATEGGDGQEGWRGGSQSVSHSLSPPSLEARGSSSVVVRGPGTEVGTDLCDTHAARRITHSVAHNIHLPCPAGSHSAPPLPLFPDPQRHREMRDRRTNTVERDSDVTIFITYWDYVIPTAISIATRRCREFWSDKRSCLRKSRNAL